MGRHDELSWNDLRHFLAAVRAGTLAGAARDMGVDHTTIGRRLSALERALGAALVVRNPDGLKLTTLGEQLAPLIEDVERAVEAVRERAAGQRVRVRLATPSGFARMFSQPLVQLCTKHPELALELVSGARPVDLAKGEADLALRSGPVTDETLVARKLCDSGWSLYAAESYLARHSGPIDPDDLSGHEVIGFDPVHASSPAAEWLEPRAASATVVLRNREMTDMLASAASGAGLAVLPCWMGDAEPGLVRVTREVVARRPISIVYRREAKLSDHVRIVIDFVADVIRAHADRLSGEPAEPDG